MTDCDPCDEPLHPGPDPANIYRHTSVDIVLDTLQGAIRDLSHIMRPEAHSDEVARLRAENARLMGLLRQNPPPRPPMLPQRRLRLASIQGWRCAICDVMLGPAFHVDHVIPYSISFDHSDKNLQVTCVPCHLTKTSEKQSFRKRDTF
jgi:5-methylcytosine-specific restriction endonuclease McrA